MAFSFPRQEPHIQKALDAMVSARVEQLMSKRSEILEQFVALQIKYGDVSPQDLELVEESGMDRDTNTYRVKWYLRPILRPPGV
jgi:hypothetical protein